MSPALFKKANQVRPYLRMALQGLPKAGKTHTALAIGTRLAELAGGRVALIDTERGSASKLAGKFDFDVLELVDDYSPLRYVKAIEAALAEGYPVVIVDSLSHGWNGSGGALELVDRNSPKGNKFDGGWKAVTPMQNKLVETILGARAHIICTMRVKAEYVIEKDERGRNVPRKIGMAPIQRPEIDYEFDFVGLMSNTGQGRLLQIEQSRFAEMDGIEVINPGSNVADQLWAILSHTKAPPAPAPIVDLPAKTDSYQDDGPEPDPDLTLNRDEQMLEAPPEPVVPPVSNQQPDFSTVKDTRVQRQMIAAWLKANNFAEDDAELSRMSAKLADDRKITFASHGPVDFLNAMIRLAIEQRESDN